MAPYQASTAPVGDRKKLVQLERLEKLVFKKGKKFDKILKDLE